MFFLVLIELLYGAMLLHTYHSYVLSLSLVLCGKKLRRNSLHTQDLMWCIDIGFTKLTLISFTFMFNSYNLMMI